MEDLTVEELEALKKEDTEYDELFKLLDTKHKDEEIEVKEVEDDELKLEALTDIINHEEK